MLNALSFDIEDYFQVEAFKSVVSRDNWNTYSCRVVDNTRRIINLLKKYDTRATFFVLGWVAEKFPTLIREIADCGHEIATHGYWHELVYRQTPKEFALDLEQSLEAINSVLGDYTVIGYRAPTFSIIEKSVWALDILQKHGIKYDSSIFPVSIHDRYGIKEANRFASKLNEDLWEFPVSTIQLGKYNLPVAGGGYFRLFPLQISRWAINRINNEGQPALMYLHPWEFDPKQPRFTNASQLSRFRHYLNLDKTENRLRALLQEFKFDAMNIVFAEQLNDA